MIDPKTINKFVFYPPLILLSATITLSLSSPTLFDQWVSNTHQFILHNFGWLFSWSAFTFIILITVCYFSSLGNVKIGGTEAKPLLSKSRWFAISICTTIATGILFWGCAEPLYHFTAPPNGIAVDPLSKNAQTFALSTMYMHWSFTPYSIYCIAGLMFALVYYNQNRSFAISSIISPILPLSFQESKSRYLVDVICLYALIMGMSASLGSGILAISGGLDHNFGISKTNTVIGLIGITIIVSFLVSAISGLQKGIKWLSTVNIVFFFFLACYVFVFSKPLDIIQLSGIALIDYITTFIPRSINTSGIETEWLFDWSIFYWANWFAWAPIASLFLGKISKGYTVKAYIRFNLIYPSLFAILWMSIFSGSTLLQDRISQDLSSLMQLKGEESVMYALLDFLPLGAILSIFSVLVIFISYVTAADSNITAMTDMSVKSSKETITKNMIIKIIWGIIIGALTWVMLVSDGIDGIRKLSVLGGFPALIIIILVGLGLVKFIIKPQLVRDNE